MLNPQKYVIKINIISNVIVTINNRIKPKLSILDKYKGNMELIIAIIGHLMIIFILYSFELK